MTRTGIKIFITITLLSIFSIFNITYGQEIPDSVISVPDEIETSDSVISVQDDKKTPDIDFDDMGVSVSPSSMHLSIKPGTSETKEITVKNITKEKNSFAVGFNDFEMNQAGKPTLSDPENRKYSLSKHIGVTPTYFELAPGEEKKIKLVISIPDDEESYRSLWTIVTIEQVVERPPLDPGDQPKRISMGIIPSFGFGVYIYQNPPNVTINKLEIQNLVFTNDNNSKKVNMSVKNIGDGISYCTSYLELTNMSTGEQYKLQVKKFTILPQYTRAFSYDLSPEIKPGKYSAIGVIDYGSKEEILAAEVEFEI
ncbi:MAG: hypothetical protein ABIJ97_08910 [Bacteroidota bacterium]